MKIPYFPFYPDDWLSSQTVNRMTLAEQGIYFQLLCLQWQRQPECNLPGDIDEICKLLGTRSHKKISKILQKCFNFDTKSYQNVRLFNEYLKAKRLHERACKAAKKRWNHVGEDANKHQGSIPTSISNQNQNQNQNQKGSLEAGSQSEPHGEVPTPEKPKKSSRRLPGKRKSEMTDEEWLSMVKANPAYQGIDVDLVQAKLIAWCATKGKQPTRSRLLNWLNREEKPLGGGNGQNATGSGGTRRLTDREIAGKRLREKFGLSRGGSGPSHFTDAGQVDSRGPGNMDSKIIEGSYVETEET